MPLHSKNIKQYCVKKFRKFLFEKLKFMSFLITGLVVAFNILGSIAENFDVTDMNGVTPTTVNGVFFDLEPQRNVRIKSFTFTKGGNPSIHNVSIYIKVFPGTFVGYENNPNVWQLWHTYQFDSTSSTTAKSMKNI